MLTSYDRYFILDKKSYMPQICFFCEGETFSLVTEMKSKLKYHSKRTYAANRVAAQLQPNQPQKQNQFSPLIHPSPNHANQISPAKPATYGALIKKQPKPAQTDKECLKMATKNFPMGAFVRKIFSSLSSFPVMG
jgi:hypothetical protein